jgi:hypothetical protein
VKRTTLKQAILQALAAHRLDALAYPTIRRKAAPVGERQLGNNCHLSANSGLPAISVPAGFIADGLPVGVERAPAARSRLRVRTGYPASPAAGKYAGALVRRALRPMYG